MQTPPVVLILAGNDPSGGAGITADIQSVTALGGHPAPVITALTVQDTRDAYQVECVKPELVLEQAQRVLDDLPVAAIKLGLLGSADCGAAVAGLLAAYPDIPVVTDPVLVAAGGAQLAEDALIRIYLEQLLPLTTVLTPNALESRRLAPELPHGGARAAALLARGAGHVLIKGGDEGTAEVINTLYSTETEPVSRRWERLSGEFHGSGCTLASAIAAGLAKGLGVTAAVLEAQAFTDTALRSAFRPGRGQSVPRRWRPV